MRRSLDSPQRTRRLAATVALAVAKNLGKPKPVNELRDPYLGSEHVAPHIVAACSYHGITPLLWEAQQHTHVAADLATATQQEYRSIVARGLRLDVATHAAVDALDSVGIGYALFKGSALKRYYPRPSLRYGSDVDILVAGADMPRADKALKSAGIAALGRGWEGQVRASVSECTYLLGDYGNIDLHWQVIPDTPVRRAFDIDVAALISRATESRIDGRSVRVLDHPDMFVSVAAHACFSGAFKLGWLVDLAVLLEDPAADWGRIAARAEQTRAALPVQVMLDRMSRTLEMPLPPVLADGAWRRVVDRSGVLWPTHRGSEQVVRGAFIYRSTRATTGQSLTALATRLPWDAPRRLRKRRRNISAM